MTSQKILSFFANKIYEELGILYDEHNFFQLNRRLEEIAASLNCSVNDVYLQAQKDLSGELKRILFDTATNNETSFFRDPKLFKAIAAKILTPLVQNAHIKIWSAASSTGQEALSLAMLIEEFNKRHKRKIAYSITASDISERVIEQAKQSIYTPLETSRGLSSDLVETYFTNDNRNHWRAKPEITQNIEYKRINLKDPYYNLEKFDLILCRNVLIYQSVSGKKEIIRKLTQHLEPEGLLALGAGETLIGLSSDYDSIECGGALLYQARKKLSAVS